MAVFVNRESELTTLTGMVLQAADGSGGFVAVHGQQGIGKSSLLNALTSLPPPTGTTFYQVSCHAQVGEFQSYGPFLLLLAQVEQAKPTSRLRRITGRATRAAAPELLNLVPAVGPLLKSAAEAVAGAVPGAPTVDPAAAAHLVTQAVLDAVQKCRPAVIIIDDVHRIDASSCAVLSLLAETVHESAILIVLLVRDDHDNTAITNLLDELHIRGRLHKLHLRGLAGPAVAEFGRRAAGLDITDEQASELASRTSGHPLILRFFLTETAGSRELTATTNRPLARPAGEEPHPAVRDQLATLIRMRLARLTADDRRLLSIGAVQGERFLSATVASVAGLDPDETETRLHLLAHRTELIVADDSATAAMNAECDGYRFEHGLLQQELYHDQSDAQRRRRHRGIAANLSTLTELAAAPPLELLLEITRHCRAGQDFVGAAQGAHGAACHLASSGASIREVAVICRHGLADLRHARPDQTVHRLRALLLELLLAATELDWTAERNPDGTNPVENSARDAIAAADASDDPNLKVRVRYLYGKVLLYTQGLDQALGPLRAAWETATASGDPVSVLLAGCEYGRQLPKVDVTAGLDVLFAAARVADNDPGILHTTDPVIIRARDMLGLQIGINLMDAGQLGASVTRLRHAVTTLRKRGTFGLLPIGLNYLAQAELATAELDRAEETLHEAAALPGNGDGGAWDAVNLAYLGWLQVVRRGENSGFALLDRARARSAQLWQANLAPLVATLYVAALLHGKLDESTTAVAHQVLDETIEETRRTGMLRSEVVALSLLGRLKSAAGEPKAALHASQEGVNHLRRVNWALAAVSTEEILVHHAIILNANGDTATAKSVLRRAASEVRRKASSLPDDQREKFLNGHPTNQLIAQTMTAVAITTSATRETDDEDARTRRTKPDH